MRLCGKPFSPGVGLRETHAGASVCRRFVSSAFDHVQKTLPNGSVFCFLFLRAPANITTAGSRTVAFFASACVRPTQQKPVKRHFYCIVRPVVI